MPLDFSGISAPPNQGLSQEELRKLIENSKKQQATQSSEGQAQPAAQQPQASKPQAQPQQQKPQQMGPAAPGQEGGAGALDPVGKWIEENIGIPVVDTIDNVFQGDQKTPDQIARERLIQRIQGTRQNIQTQRNFEAAQGPAGTILGETLRAGLGAGEDLVEGLVNLPGQALDLVSPYNHTPIRSNLIRENETAVGQGLRTIGRYVLSARLGGKVTGGALTANQTGAALFGGRFAQGFIDDFLGADGTGDDGTLIGNTPFTKMLQTADENQAIHNRALVGIEGGLFEAVGLPAVQALWKLRKPRQVISEATKRSQDLVTSLQNTSKGFAKNKKAEELSDLLARLGEKEGLDLGGTFKTDLPTFEQKQLSKLPPNHWLRRGYELLTGDDLPADEITELLRETKRRLADPAVLRNEKELKRLVKYNEMLRTAAAPKLMREANKSVSAQLMEIFPGSQNVPEAELIRRLQTSNPERLNLLIAEAADTVDEADPIYQYVASRIEALPAAQELDNVANTVQYGGPPDEIVIDGTRLSEYTDELKAIEAEQAPLNEELEIFTDSVRQNVELTNTLNQRTAVLSRNIAGLQASLDDLPRAADLQKASEINLSVSKAQVARLQQIKLPEGVTITAGRRVKGLTLENIDEFRAAVAELGASGDKVASNLSIRLDNLELPEAVDPNRMTREAAEEQLAQMKQERDLTFQQTVQRRMERRDIGTLIRELQAKSDNLKVQRDARVSRLTGNVEQFQADYQPVALNRQNVTSIVKERAGGQPGFDLYFEDKRFPALLDGRVKEIGRQGTGNSGYGNYIVVESIDPRTGESVDVLYAHLADGSVMVKEGDMVGVGQQIAKQGGTGRVVSADGTIASVDFLAPAPKGSKSMTPYKRWSDLVDELAVSIHKGELKPSQVGRKAPSVAPEVIDDVARQADETIAPKTRKQAIEEGFEIDEVVPAKARTSLIEDFTTEPHQTVVGTAKPGKASLTDMDVYSLNNGTPEGMRILEQQVEEIDRYMMYDELGTLEKMQGSGKLAEEWLEKPLDELMQEVQTNPEIASMVEGHPLLSQKGYAATGLVLRELQNQLIDLGYNTVRHSAMGSPEAQKEAVRLLDRFQAMLQLRTVHKQVASGKLRELKYIGDNLGAGAGDVGFRAQSKSAQLDEMIAKHRDDLAKDQAIYRTFDALRAEIRKGNPAAFSHLERVAKGLTLMAPTQSNFRVMQTVMAAMGKNVDALYVNSILSGPITQARNFWGNFYQTTGHPVLAYMGALLPGKKNAAIRMQAIAAIGANLESYAEFGSLIARATREQWSLMGRATMDAAESGIKEYGVWDETLEANMRRVERMRDAGELHWHQEMMYTLAIMGRKAMDSPIMRPLMAVMGGVDQTFKVIAARQLASRRAVEDVLKELGDAPLSGKRAAEFGARMADAKQFHLDQIFDATGAIKDEEAIELGQTFTFSAPLGEADQLTKSLNKLSSVPLMKTLGLTFVKTPSNILKSAANLTPGVSSVLKRMDAKYRNGSDFYRAQRDGAEAMSYMLGAGMFYLGMQGTVTGAGPLTGPERQLWLQNHKPFTITIGDMEINYQGWEPAASVMGLFADLGALAFGDRKGDLSLVSAVAALSSNVVNKSYLAQVSTMAQVIGAVSEKDYKRLGENIARGLVPFSGLRSQVGQIVDPSLREVRSQIEPSWEWFLKKQTGLGSTKALPQKVDEITGKPLTREGLDGMGGNILAAMNPLLLGARFSKSRFEPVHKYLDEVGLDVSNGLNKIGSQDLTNEEMTEYIKLRAANGEMKDSLLAYFKSDRYQKVDKISMEEDLKLGKEYSETVAYKNANAIVQGFHRRAIAQMQLGLSDVTAGFAKRYREAQKGAFQAENRHNNRSDVLRPTSEGPLNTTLLY